LCPPGPCCGISVCPQGGIWVYWKTCGRVGIPPGGHPGPLGPPGESGLWPPREGVRVCLFPGGSPFYRGSEWFPRVGGPPGWSWWIPSPGLFLSCGFPPFEPWSLAPFALAPRDRVHQEPGFLPLSPRARLPGRLLGVAFFFLALGRSLARNALEIPPRPQATGPVFRAGRQPGPSFPHLANFPCGLNGRAVPNSKAPKPLIWNGLFEPGAQWPFMVCPMGDSWVDARLGGPLDPPSPTWNVPRGLARTKFGPDRPTGRTDGRTDGTDGTGPDRDGRDGRTDGRTDISHI